MLVCEVAAEEKRRRRKRRRCQMLLFPPLGFISGRRRKRKRKVVINDVKKVRDSLDRRSERRQFFRSTKNGTVWRRQEGAP